MVNDTEAELIKELVSGLLSGAGVTGHYSRITASRHVLLEFIERGVKIGGHVQDGPP
jgi:hypothetical protein